MEGADIVVCCRALIVHNGKLMVVKHSPGAHVAALPGGRLERGEHVPECMRRELFEELGVEPDIGTLQYVYTFADSDERQSMEFFFSICNAADFVDGINPESTHAHEIAEILWVGADTTERILPEVVLEDFKSGTLISDEVRFVSSLPMVK